MFCINRKITKDVSNNTLEDIETRPLLNYVDLNINGQPIRINTENTTQSFELNTLNSDTDIIISATETEYYDIYFDGILLENGSEITYRVRELDKNYVIPITVYNKKTAEKVVSYLQTWPSTVPTYTIVVQSPYEGDYYLTLIAGIDNVAMKIGSDGKLKYYYVNPYGCVADFKKVNTSDGVRYLYFTTVDMRYDTRGVSHSGCYVVLDESYREINRLTMKKSKHIPVDNYPVDQHDCIYISDSEYYMITYCDENVYNIPDTIPHKEYGSFVTAAVIQGIKDNTVVFEWASTDFEELYGLSVDYNDFTNSSSSYAADYMHINSITLDPSDGNMIASFRDIDTILKIDISSGEIMWKLSGLADDFGLKDEQKTSRQQYASYTDIGTITAFDNGNINSQSRIVEYRLDESTQRLVDFKAYQIDGYYSAYTGSVQRLDDDDDVYMIGWGTRTAGDINGLYPQLSEINFTEGKTLFELRFTDSNLSTYRCVKCK